MGERVSATQRGSRPLHNPVSNIPYGVVQRRSAAFLSPGSAGLYAPWRSGHLSDHVKTRRGVSVPLVVRSGSYMDDLVLMGRRWADIQSAARKITK